MLGLTEEDHQKSGDVLKHDMHEQYIAVHVRRSEELHIVQ